MMMQQGITNPAAIEAAMEQTATDLGSPGRDDVFDLFSPGANALASGKLDGGNIQVHPACRVQ